jgi:hypothetical protein
VFNDSNQTVDAFILLTSDGIPFKYSFGSLSDEVSYKEAVNYAGLLHDLIQYTKKVLDDLKKNNYGNLSLRLRLLNGTEIIIVQGN